MRIKRASGFAALLLAAAVGHAGFSPARAQNLLLPGVAGMDYSLRVESFAERRYRNAIRQQYDFSCGSAALATLLTYHYGLPTTEVAVFQEMFAHADQAEVRREGFSLFDMQQYLARRGLQANGYRAPLSVLERAQVPAITLVNSNGYSHFVVVKGVRDGRVLLADPSFGTRAVDRATFEQEWNGILFVVMHESPEVRASFNRERDWNAQPRAPLELARDLNTSLGSLAWGWRDPGRF